MINPCDEAFTCGCIINFFPFWETLILGFFENTVGLLICGACQGDGKLNQCCYLLPVDLRTGMALWAVIQFVLSILTILKGIQWFDLGFWFWGVYSIGFGVFAIWMSYLFWRGSRKCEFATLSMSINIQTYLILCGIGVQLFWVFTIPGYGIVDWLLNYIIIGGVVVAFFGAHIAKLAVLIRDDGGDNAGMQSQVKGWKEDAEGLPFHGCGVGQGGGAATAADGAVTETS